MHRVFRFLDGPDEGNSERGIGQESGIRSPSTAAAVSPQSSAAFSSQRSCENHPPPRLLPRQITVDDPAITALPRVLSSEAFGRRPYTGSTSRAGPASETLHDSGYRPC